MMPHEQYRQDGQPQIRMDREAHLYLFRGYRDLEPNAKLSAWCRRNIIDVNDYKWMRERLAEIDAVNASETGYSEQQRTS